MIRMEVSKISKYRKLVKEDRILIAQWKNKGYSNSQVAKWLGRLKLDYHNNSERQIGVETIYRFIYKSGNKKLRLWDYLRRKQVRRRKKGGRKAQRER
ncbi:MAG: helix-turn-helix domain-containing protein [Patescibacteria group bacterium]